MYICIVHINREIITENYKLNRSGGVFFFYAHFCFISLYLYIMACFHTKTFTKHDDYMTPKHVWEDISHLIPKDKVIWEAFYGEGSSGNHLRELGCKEVIHEDKDFFSYTPEYDICISNPPFSDCKNIIPRLKELNKPFILIMPCSKIACSYMRNNFMNNQLQIIIPRKRIHFIKLIDNKLIETNKCNFDCFYYCYKMNFEKDIIWLE